MVYDQSGSVIAIDVNSFWLEIARARLDEARNLIVAVSALEARYLPSIVERLQLPSISEFGEYDRWRERQRLSRSVLRWLDVRPAWLRMVPHRCCGRLT